MYPKIRRSLAIVLVLLIAACARPVSIKTPEGKRAYDIDQVLKRVEELQEAAIAAFKSGAILKSDVDPIVNATIEIARLSEAAELGWKEAALYAWNTAKAEIPVLQPGGKFSALAAAIDEVLK